MKKSKKLISLVVAAVMALGVLVAPVEALAVGTTTDGTNGIGKYVVTSTKKKTLTMTGLTAKGKKKTPTISIGASITATGQNSGKYKVTLIKKNAFKGAKATKIILPATVTKIEHHAFNGVKTTKTLTIGIKSTKLTAKKVAGMLKGCKAKKVIIKVPKSKLKAYKKFMTKANLGLGAKGKVVVKRL